MNPFVMAALMKPDPDPSSAARAQQLNLALAQRRARHFGPNYPTAQASNKAARILTLLGYTVGGGVLGALAGGDKKGGSGALAGALLGAGTHLAGGAIGRLAGSLTPTDSQGVKDYVQRGNALQYFIPGIAQYYDKQMDKDFMANEAGAGSAPTQYLV